MKTLKLFFSLLAFTFIFPSLSQAESIPGIMSGATGLVRTATGKAEVISVARWETQYRDVLEGMYPGEGPDVYLKRVLDTKIRPIDAFLASRLEQSLSQVLRAQWIDVPNLELLPVQSKVKGSYRFAQWNLAQLLVHDIQSTITGTPIVTIYFNRYLFNQLSSFDIALVLLHEAVYVSEAGLIQPKDSYNARKVVTLLLAKDTLGMNAQKRSQRSSAQLADKLHSKLRHLGFDDLAHSFEFGVRTTNGLFL